MAMVVLLKGVNVGGYRSFRPSVLAKELSQYDVVNIGAAGTFVVRKRVSREKLRTEMLARLPFQAEVIMCDGRDLIRATEKHPFDAARAPREIVRFVSILSKAQRLTLPLPMHLPPDGEWLVRIMSCHGRFLFGTYKRQMRVLSYLGQMEKLVGVPITTRNWNTVAAVVSVLKLAPERIRGVTSATHPTTFRSSG